MNIGGYHEKGFLNETEKQLPNCLFRVIVTNSTEVEQAVLNNQADIAIVEGTIKNENLIVIPVCEDGTMVILSLKDVRVTRNFNLVYHKNKYLSEELQKLKEICSDWEKDGRE